MLSIAEKIVLDTGHAAATTFSQGYAVMYDGSKKYFPPGRPLAERRNKDGRVTFAKYAYVDESTLTFTYHGQRGSKMVAGMAQLEALQPA